MPTLKCVSEEKISRKEFCFTDCGPADGCNPDDIVLTNKESK